jgi:hypothetical protein
MGDFRDGLTMTKSLHIALADLHLDKAWIVYPGTAAYPVHERVDVVPITALADRIGFMA